VALVQNRQFHFTLVWDAPGRKLKRERLLVHGLQEAAAELAMDLHGGANNRTGSRGFSGLVLVFSV